MLICTPLFDIGILCYDWENLPPSKGEVLKSHNMFILKVLECLLKDMSRWCSTDWSRDFRTIKSRFEHEGLSFLTITLPQFGKDFEKSLERGSIAPTDFHGFRKSGKAPAFLQGYFVRVFDVETGGLLDDPLIEAISAIRQVSYLFKKLKMPCTQDRVQRSLREFTEIEAGFQCKFNDNSAFSDSFISIAKTLWPLVFEGFNPFELSPKHGPGAVAERISPNAKYKLHRWHERLESFFPVLGTGLSCSAYESDDFNNVSFVSDNDEQPVRVITVPKTLKAPRIIAIEPVCNQYIQQAVAGFMIPRIENHYITGGHINFTDQTVNQTLAMKASRTGLMATLDLSSASDRVPFAAVDALFSSIPDLCQALKICRSSTAELPNGDILHLRKFASMGSALCFPVEALYFYTICIEALLDKYNLPPTQPSIEYVARLVYVYGDDIIVPTDDVDIVIDYLQRYNCKVNTDKSFWNGKFRESCGADCYDGYSVTPIYIRMLPPDDKRSSAALVSWVETSNHFYKNGCWLTSSILLERIEELLGELPIVGEKAAFLGKVTFQRIGATSLTSKYNKALQRRQFLCWTAEPVYQKDILDGYPALTKSLLNLERRLNDDSFVDSQHLSRTARHGTVTLKRRWV